MKNKTNNHDPNKIFNQSYRHNLALHQMIMSVSHMTDTTRLDERCFSAVVHLKHDNGTDVKKLIQLQTNKMVGLGAYTKSLDRPGCIVSDDFEGSRIGQPTNHGRHYHVTIFWPEPIAGGMLRSASTLETIRFGLRQIEEVSNVDVQRYSLEKPIHELIDYGSKTEKKDWFDPARKGVDTLCLPFEMDVDSLRSKPRHLDQAKERFDQALNRFYDDPQTFFQLVTGNSSDRKH